MIINSLLDTDLYKLTMQQVVFHKFPEAMVQYRFRCRNSGVDLAPYAVEIREEIDHLCSLRITDDEMNYLRSIRYLQPSYVDSLIRLSLNPENVHITTEGGFSLTIEGNWYQTILFEVPVRSISGIKQRIGPHRKRRVSKDWRPNAISLRGLPSSPSI